MYVYIIQIIIVIGKYLVTLYLQALFQEIYMY